MFLLSLGSVCITPGEEQDNRLQYSSLENPHGQRSLAGYSPWACKELDMTEWLSHIQSIVSPLSPSSVPPPPYLFSLSFHKLPRNFPWRDKQQLHSHLQFLCYPETHLILIKIFSAHLLSLPGSIPSQKCSLAIPVSPTTFILTPR